MIFPSLEPPSSRFSPGRTHLNSCLPPSVGCCPTAIWHDGPAVARIDVSPPPGGMLLTPVAGAIALAQGPLQARGISEALVRVLGQAAQHDALQVLGDIGADP